MDKKKKPDIKDKPLKDIKGKPVDPKQVGKIDGKPNVRGRAEDGKVDAAVFPGSLPL